MHQSYLDQSLSVTIPDRANFHYDLVADVTFVVPDYHQGVVTLVVGQCVQARVQFYCASSVDLTIRLIMVSAQVVDINLLVVLCGNGSQVKILGICALHQQESVKLTTQQIHCGQDSNSHLVLHSLLSGSSRFTYDGTIRIEQHARGTYGLQRNKNILLSDTAHAISIPNIEVLNHDVQCYHGAAIGRFEKQQKEYLQSRGLDVVMVQKLLVQAFFAEVLHGYEKKDLILQSVYEKI